MLKIDRNRRSFVQLEGVKLRAVAASEKSELQQYIMSSPEAFFAELGKDVFLIGRDVWLSEAVPDRVDLLAVDRQGRLVVTGLPGGSGRLQHLQAISCAANFSVCLAERAIRQRHRVLAIPSQRSRECGQCQASEMSAFPAAYGGRH